MDNMKPEEMNRLVLDGMKKSAYEILHVLDENSEEAARVNRELLMRILSDSKDTGYGKKYDFSSVMDADDYRKKVPLSDYSTYEDAIIRMTENGEKNLLTPYPIVYYASTSGTSGNPKKIPVSDRGLDIFRTYSSVLWAAVISEFYKNTKLEDVPYGYAMSISSYSRETLADGTMFGAISAACLDEKTIQVMPFLISTPPEVMFEKGSANLKYLHARYSLEHGDVAYMTGSYIPALLDLMNYIRDEWKLIVSDIREGKIDDGITMPGELRAKLTEKLRPNPKRADELEREFEKGFDRTIMKRIWPKLSVIAAIWAGNFSSYARKLQEYSGRSIPYYTMSYVSSEGIFGVARHPHDQYYVLIPNSCFYEFIPVDGKEGEDADAENPKTLLIDEVEEGKEYELVITNQSGFYRYRMGDVIRVIGFYNESPMVVFKYRKKNIVSIAGEKFTEDHLLSAVREFERRSGIPVIDFCMYPDRDAEPGRYVILLEPDEIVPASRMEECRKILGEELARASTSYAHYVAGGNMGEPKLIFLQRQTFQLQREMKMYKMGISENQLKPVRVLNTPELIKFFTSLEEKA